MIVFFQNKTTFFAVSCISISDTEKDTLSWLFGSATFVKEKNIKGIFIGPRKEMITPWSTNAVEITENMGIKGIKRIEKFIKHPSKNLKIDPMLEQIYQGLFQDIFEIKIQPEPIKTIENIKKFNKKEGLALNQNEIEYLEKITKKLGRKLTDSEIFGFSQINSEHCRHKIFNGTFIIDGHKKSDSLFKLIKKTSQKNPKNIISAYKDNVAFIKGGKAMQFAPEKADKPDFYKEKEIDIVFSLKAETHNFPTTVEPLSGAATGSGGEIRDRLAGGIGSLPLAGTAVYMTSYPHSKKNRTWEKYPQRKWLYRTPLDILIKASNGASDFGNKFGQPLICGSLLTFEFEENERFLGYDKVIMQAGGIGYAKTKDSLKKSPEKDDEIVLLGGANYRIGMGGAAVSSANTGNMQSNLERNAVQRANPEMQKRTANVIRAMVENEHNKIIAIHDHGAGGHLNCFSELVEKTGGNIYLEKLPVGDPTLSAKEIMGNESQERLGIVIKKEDLENLEKIAERERCPIYKVGKVNDDKNFIFINRKTSEKPMDLSLEDLFGNAPKTILKDESITRIYENFSYKKENFKEYLKNVLQLEAVACKDWLTNKVDRCVGGKVAKQQCVGALQLPLNNVGVSTLDYKNKQGIATSIGHAPIVGLIDAKIGSRRAIAEALTNVIWAPLEENLKSVSLSANWMWACKNKGEDARLYEAVAAASEFAMDLEINIPTGKDSLSMTQKYEYKNVIAPGTVIISTAAKCNDINKIMEPVFKNDTENFIYHIDFSNDAFKLGGSCFLQSVNTIGKETPDIKDAQKFKMAFDLVQKYIKENKILAGHDISCGGMITCLLELCFASQNIGATINLRNFKEEDFIKILFAENNGVILQIKDEKMIKDFEKKGIKTTFLGKVTQNNFLKIKHKEGILNLNIEELRDVWYESSYLLDKKQSGEKKAKERFENYKKQPLHFKFPENFQGIQNKKIKILKQKPIAAVMREKGSNSEREMANALYMAGFEVKDVHMTDLISGREDLKNVQFLAAVGGFSNSDVLGSAKGWAGAFLYNEKAKKTLFDFFEREDTLSLGVCNGCQLFMELNLMYPHHNKKPKMLTNDSKKHESNFVGVRIPKNNAVMLENLESSNLGVWISHGEGKFHLPLKEEKYNIVGKYSYSEYPANPNGSDYNTAMLCSENGRHLVMMPHMERSIFSWNWAYYPENKKQSPISPWLKAFENARIWMQKKY